MTKIYKVGKLENPVDLYTDDVYMYGDVTNMTQGQFNQYLEAQRFRLLAKHHGGIANYDEMADSISPTSPIKPEAFTPNVRNNVIKFIRKVSGMTKPAFPSFNFNGTAQKKHSMGSILTDLLKPIINWIFSIMIPKAAPFFLYVYLDNPHAKGILLTKKGKQTAILQKIASTAGIPYENLKASVKSALYGILGKSPKDWLDDIINAQIATVNTNKPYDPVSAQNVKDKTNKMNSESAQNVKDKTNKIGAAPLAAIVPFIPLILGALSAVAMIASKLIETVPDLVGKDQLSDKQLNDAAPSGDNFLDEILGNIFPDSGSTGTSTNTNTGTQYPQYPTTSQQNKGISTGMILGGAGLLLGGYLLFKK